MSADKKKPAGDSTHPAGRTDSADFTSSIVKTAIVSFFLGLAISSCSPVHAGKEESRAAQHQRNQQPNQPKTHAQQAQAATETVAKAPTK